MIIDPKDPKTYENLSPENFERVQDDGKIFDKKFETKPIGYFKDAMIRFGKNKTNVVATSILFFIILCSIVIPMVSTKNVDELDDNFAALPPRMPYLEAWGIADGTDHKSDQAVDPDTIDPATGLGIPEGYEWEYVVEGTLTNYTQGCTLADELCEGGQSTLRVTSGFDHVGVESPVNISVQKSENPTLTIVVTDFNSEEGELVVMTKGHTSEYRQIGVITSEGTYTYDLNVNATGASDYYNTNVQLFFWSENVNDVVAIESVEISQDSFDPDQYLYEGFELSEFPYIVDEEDTTLGGYYQRQNGELLLADFVYDVYGHTFADRQENALPNSVFLQIMEDHADVCQSEVDPENPEVGLIFTNDACPVKKVISKTSAVIVDGEEKFSYTVIWNYAQYKGYDEVPFFLFGTDAAGRDLFTLLWVATRTSLLLGFVVAGINIIIGVIYGSISGYYGGVTDLIMQRISEVVGRIPWLVILSIMIALLGPGIQTLIFILIVQGWIGVAAITRTQFYRYKGREYVLASRTLGAKDGRLIFRHILPNGIGTIITTSVLTIPYVIFNESTISFLGFGIGHGQSFNVFGIEFSGVSVGVLLADGQRELQQRPYLTVFPAILISILMITFNMFGNALRDAFNPALRGSE